jgi:hypothetical protein
LLRASFSAASPIVRATTMLLSDTETARSRRGATHPKSRSQGYLHWIGRSPPSSGKLRQRPAHEGNLRRRQVTAVAGKTRRAAAFSGDVQLGGFNTSDRVSREARRRRAAHVHAL